MTTSLLILREGDASQLVELPRATADALTAAQVVEIRPTTHADQWEIAAGTRLGW